jgi:hypothetical protein
MTAFAGMTTAGATLGRRAPFVQTGVMTEGHRLSSILVPLAPPLSPGHDMLPAMSPST